MSNTEFNRMRGSSKAFIIVMLPIMLLYTASMLWRLFKS